MPHAPPTIATAPEAQPSFNTQLLKSDLLVLKNLLQDVDEAKSHHKVSLEDSGYVSRSSSYEKLEETGPRALEFSETRLRLSDTHVIKESHTDTQLESSNHPSPRDIQTLKELCAANDPHGDEFEPTVFSTWDLSSVQLPLNLNKLILYPYIRWAKTIARNPADVVMVTQLIMCFLTSIPSAIILFWRFNYLHGILHTFMQVWYAGTYNCMMHQHIHMRGILSRKYSLFDHVFPYITDPLHGHTWNSYYFHHVKHHHVEGNGPDDLSSTIRYQRDNFWHFLHYFARFFFLIWFDLPQYYIRKGKADMALKIIISELGNYLAIYTMATFFSLRATVFVFIIPFVIMRIGLMVGNWGQHAFVDEVDPDSDFRSSITLIDVASNRFCYNDGYHTSHHLNPRRHWREHPVSFLQQKQTYAKESALVFQDIDYLMITVRLLMKDYTHIAKRLVPMGSQIGMTVPEIAAMLETKTRRFTEAEIEKKFNPKPTFLNVEKIQ